MNTQNGGIFFGAGIDMNEWRKNVNEMRKDILGLREQTQQETSKMDNAFKKFSLGLGAYFSVSVLQGFTQQLINVRGEFQKTEIAFGTMLQSKEKAKQLMGEMVDLAAKTPFSLSDVSQGAKQLLAFQVPANQVMDTLRRIGDIAAALGIPISRLNLVYGQVMAKGKLMGDDLRQFTEAGIPMVAELAKQFGKTSAEIYQMVSEGKIGFKDVQKVLFDLTNEGGLFFNMMEQQSASLSGKMERLKDAFEQMLNKIGESNEGILVDGIEGVTYLVENYEEVIKVLSILIATYGTYKAVLIATATIQKMQVMGKQIQLWLSLAKSINTAKDAQALFNLTTSANPLGAVLAVLGLLITTYITYGDEIKKLIGLKEKDSAATKVQTEVQSQYDEKFKKGIIEKRGQIESLITVIKNENSTLDQRKRAYESLIAIDPSFRGTLDNQYKATFKLAEAFDVVIAKMQSFAMAQARMSAVKSILEVTPAFVVSIFLIGFSVIVFISCIFLIIVLCFILMLQIYTKNLS